MVVVKEMKFEAAHMLSNYEGQCRNLHGHSYKVHIMLESIVNADNCMVEDFNDIKNKATQVVQDLDHAIIFSDEDYRNEAEDKLKDWADEYGMDYVVVRGRCTCEMIALYIKEEIEEIFDNKRVHVRLWETATSYVEI